MVKSNVTTLGRHFEKLFREQNVFKFNIFLRSSKSRIKTFLLKFLAKTFPPRASFNSQKDYPTTTTAADTFLQYLISLSLVNQSILKAVCSSTTTTVATQPVIIFNINFSIIKGNLIEIKRFGKTV